MSLAAYAFARVKFPGRTCARFISSAQLMLVPSALLVPNLTTIVRLGLYDTLPGVMAPYFATAFGHVPDAGKFAPSRSIWRRPRFWTARAGGS